jgi:hypothetical protein
LKNVADFDRVFRFIGQKHTCAALKDERRADVNIGNPKNERKKR